MDVPVASSIATQPAVVVLQPALQTIPVIFASPHSGRTYPDDFLAATRLDPLGLRRSEDSFVDELFAAAPEHGAPLLAATFPRAYCDANREPWELDPAMFAGYAWSDGRVSPGAAQGRAGLPRAGAGR